jgi:hypothetical protein
MQRVLKSSTVGWCLGARWCFPQREPAKMQEASTLDYSTHKAKPVLASITLTTLLSLDASIPLLHRGTGDLQMQCSTGLQISQFDVDLALCNDCCYVRGPPQHIAIYLSASKTTFWTFIWLNRS